MTIRKSFNIISSYLLLTLVFSSPVRANLLVDPGFESGVVTTAANVLGNFPVYQGQWGQEVASDTGPNGGVTPFQGVLMHSMSDDGLTATQTFQTTDVTAYSALINSGNATVNMSAMFDANQNLPAAIGAVYVQFFSGNSYGTQIGSGVTSSLTLDALPATWQPISVSAPIPVGTTWIMSQVLYNDASLHANGAMYPGYVDAADLTITAVPEPGTLTLFATGGLGLAACLWRRRRARRQVLIVSAGNGTCAAE
jgi:hypothetical protein